MPNTAEIRMENRNQLRRRIWQGGEHTKQSLARDTGLSIATCSTLLNEMENDGEIVSVKRRLADVGRTSSIYRANEEKDLILCLHCDLMDGKPTQSWTVMTVTGHVLSQNLMQPQDTITTESLSALSKQLLHRFPAISQIMLGVPGVVEGDFIRRCDIASLTDQPLRTMIQSAANIPVHMENDMHYRIYGYACEESASEDVLTLLYWNRSVLPGTATCHKGTILTGQNHFAGCAMLLPSVTHPAEQLSSRESAQFIIDETVLSILSLLNPGVMILSGDLFSPDSVLHLQKICEQAVPKAYLPRLVYAQSTEKEYLCGMYQRALDLKCLHK